VTMKPRDTATAARAFETLGYSALKHRYGIKCLNVFERPFTPVELARGYKLSFSVDALESDFIINLPVMKSHSQAVVSLGIKNLKGLIDPPSRKRCHSMTPGRDLHAWVSRLAERMPPMLTLIDNIYTNERGPGFDGRMHRSNILVASADALSADLVGARILGHGPENVPHLVNAARNRGRPWDLSDIEILGEKVEGLAKYHAYDFK
jgi:uncharacterized protein (DUF362 family)